MDEKKYDTPEKVAKRLLKMITSHKAARPPIRELLDQFNGKEKQKIILHLYVKSQKLELLRSDLDDVLVNTMLFELLLYIAYIPIGAKILSQTPWFMKKLVSITSAYPSERSPLLILLWISMSYSRISSSKWKILHKRGAIGALVKTLG